MLAGFCLDIVRVSGRPVRDEAWSGGEGRTRPGRGALCTEGLLSREIEGPSFPLLCVPHASCLARGHASVFVSATMDGGGWCDLETPKSASVRGLDMRGDTADFLFFRQVQHIPTCTHSFKSVREWSGEGLACFFFFLCFLCS